MINGNAESVHLECQCRMLHVWTVIVWLAGKFQESYEPSHIQSIFTVARCVSVD
jgi:hypothetical protein